MKLSLQKFATSTSIIVIVALTLWPTTVIGNSTNFGACLLNVRQGSYGVGLDIGGTDNHGRPVNVSDAVGLTYNLCTKACGGGQEPFSWSQFWMQFIAWLVPWLALISQLPFGAYDKVENLASVFLTVGSPTLAAYSFVLTVLNKRWIIKRFKIYDFPNTTNAINILNSLQQAPLDINKSLLPSLVVLAENDQWWSKLARELDYTQTWSIATATSIAWVVLTFIFTVINSFIGNLETSINTGNGQGVGSLWLWLLPIAVGWLQISPKCDKNRLRNAVLNANKMVFVATDNGGVELPPTAARAFSVRLFKDPESLSRTESFHDGLRLDPLHSNTPLSPVQHVTPSSQHNVRPSRLTSLQQEEEDGALVNPQMHSYVQPHAEHSGSLLGSDAMLSPPRHVPPSSEDDVHPYVRPTPLNSLQRDEECTLPIYNYARFFPWVQAVDEVSEAFEAAFDKKHDHRSVSSRKWVSVSPGDFHPANRVGTFEQVKSYCTSKPARRHHWRQHWGRESLDRIFFASILALTLQWGTTVAAVIINWFTPTIGFGCRSGLYLLYAVLSTFVWMLLLGSSILTHFCAARPENHEAAHPNSPMISGWPRTMAKRLSIAFRRLGKIIAIVNTFVIFFACVLQFAKFFDRCFCNSAIFSLRDHAYNVISLSADDISGVKAAWIGGVSLAATTVTFYFMVVCLWINPALP